MFDKRPYLQTIRHAADEGGEIESSHLKAFKIDDKGGLAQDLGFHAGMLSKVDYFVSSQHIVQLIELSDLEDSCRYCHTLIQKAFNELNAAIAQAAQEQAIPIREISKREENAIVKAAWKEIKDEFFKKWSGSIAVIERLYRKTNELGEADPTYTLLVVCKNHTDIEMLEPLKRQLSGMMGNVKVCDTQTLKDCLIKLE